jgi:hypothetical protein
MNVVTACGVIGSAAMASSVGPNPTRTCNYAVGIDRRWDH